MHWLSCKLQLGIYANLFDEHCNIQNIRTLSRLKSLCIAICIHGLTDSGYNFYELCTYMYNDDGDACMHVQAKNINYITVTACIINSY